MVRTHTRTIAPWTVAHAPELSAYVVEPASDTQTLEPDEGGSPDLHIACCFYTGDGQNGRTTSYRAVARANARLIAAAPDLLAVAQGALAYLEALPAACRPDPEWLAPLRAAIAKASR